MVHFLAIGLGVFLLFGLRGQVPAARSDTVIEVTPAQVAQLAGQFEAVWRRQPTASERDGLIDDYVREEVYYREALALGLDRDDTVIRRRLMQKMEFLTEGPAADTAPDDATLRAYFAAHPERFVRSTRVTFEQVVLGDGDPVAALAALNEGAAPDSVGRGSLLPPAMEGAVQTSVDGAFGDGFFAGVTKLAPGVWQGPVASAFGEHLVRLEELEPGRMPPFEEVRTAVEADWRQQTAADQREAGYRALRDRYTVLLPDGTDPAK